jgi:hypothetical protein
MRDEAALEAALEILAPFGPDLSNGMTSHAPMAVEALCTLGRGDTALPWIERYRPLLLPRPRPRGRIDTREWRASLGREERAAEWSAFFGEELANAPWQDVLARWTGRLAPGLCAAATHGVLRVAHAARSLAHAETALRRDELAAALGYWAATYQTLPTGAGAGTASSARAALGRVERVPIERRRFDGTITGALAALDDHPSFAAVIDRFDAERPADTAIADLTEAFARAFLANAHDPLSAIVFVHGITSSAALRSLVPFLDPGTAREALRYAWQAGAALYATFGTAPPVPGDIEPPAADRDTWIDRAVAHGDEHAIKGVEACLAEHARHPSPAYLAAACRLLDVLPR